MFPIDLEPAVAEEGVDDVSSGLASAAVLPENGSDSHDRGYGASNNTVVQLESDHLPGKSDEEYTKSSSGSRSGFVVDASNKYTVLPRGFEEEDQGNTCRVPGWPSYAAFTHGFSSERNVQSELSGKSDEKNTQTSSCGTGSRYHGDNVDAISKSGSAGTKTTTASQV
jgi:hypothetical protein